MIAIVAYDNEMDNKLMEQLLSGPDLIYHKGNKENDRAQDTGRKQVNNERQETNPFPLSGYKIQSQELMSMKTERDFL